MNQSVLANYARVKTSLLYLPIGLLLLMVVFLYTQHALNIDDYRQIQKGTFFFLNGALGHFPTTIDNLTQIGDGLVFFALFSILIIYASETLGAMVYALLATTVFANIFKWLFAVPRPAATFDNDKFIIIGQTLRGHNSFPSGHSITIFALLTVLMFAFLPKAKKHQLLWFFIFILAGLLLVSTRVGVGAHYPLDVLTGSLLGYIAGLTGIYLNRNFRMWDWMGNQKYYPFFIILLLVCAGVMAGKIMNRHLPIHYLALVCSLISLFFIIRYYVGYLKK